MRRHWMYRLRTAASYLPWPVLNAANRRWPADPETCEGFWFDAHYARYCREDSRKRS